MTNTKFTVIKGGSSSPKDPERRFVSAYVTDTRLMGVLGLSIRWEQEGISGPEDFYQFFYYDAEEYGLETYRSLLGEDDTALVILEQALIGGLGGKKIEITRQEAVYLVQTFAEASKRLDQALPFPKKEYEFLLEEPLTLTAGEKQEIIKKICTPILSDFQLIHYFLMRCFAHDYEAAAYLAADIRITDAISGVGPATLCKNTVEEFLDEEGNLSYLCESLIELENKYMLIVSEITIENKLVTHLTQRSSFVVTPQEVAMMLNRREYVTLYEIMCDPDEFDSVFLPLMTGAMQTPHDNGRLYLEFQKTNDHVNRKIFRLNEDIHCLYYVTDYGQLVVAAYDLGEIQNVESFLYRSPMCNAILPTAKYEFQEPVLYEFIQSDYDDFADFINSLKTDQ